MGGPHYKVGGREDLNIKNIQRTVLMMGRTTEQIADVPCGNTVALVGVDQYILRQQTSGQAFPQCVFDHWENLPGDAMQVGGKMEELILQIRKRKNLKVAMPALGDYLDKL